LRCCGSIRNRGSRARGGPRVLATTVQGRPRRHPCGLLAGACRPPDQVGGLRRSRRPRAMGLTSASQPFQQRPKALTPMPLKLPHVVSDVTGETGMAIMRAMLAGARDPVPWARLRHDRCHHDEETIAQALRGQWRAEPRWALAPAVARDDRSHQKIAACDRQSEAPLGTCAEPQERDVVRPLVRPRKRTRQRPRFDVRGPRQRVTGVDRTAIEGLDEPTAVTSIRAIGLDMGRWPTVTPCTAWRGRCPHHRGSGGTG